jgi:Cdc6-like AAA superfamily ATPase
MSVDSIKEAVKTAVLAYQRPDLHYPAQDKTAKFPLTGDAVEVDRMVDFRLERFIETKEEGILYRPEIVRAMKDQIFSLKNKLLGIMVKGPHGIGKSHSLVNLVRTLRADGHIVTFIPDCEKWNDSFFFIQAVCRSLGATASGLGITSTSFNDSTTYWDFAETIVQSLEQLNKNKNEKVHWILVFDQINRIFGRQGNEKLKDVGVLPLPFQMMKTLHCFENVHTVISASADNTLSYKENHEGFRTYDHHERR